MSLKFKLKLPAVFLTIRNRKTIVIPIIVGLVLIGLAASVSIKQINDAKARKQAVLEQLAKDQQTKAEELASKSVISEEGHPDVSDLQFKDISEGTYKKPSCGRLENRPGIMITNTSCGYRIRAFGKLTMAVVFVYASSNSSHAQLVSLDANDKNSLRYINTYLKAEAARYKAKDPPQIEMSFYGPYKVDEPVLSVYYRDNGSKLLDIYNKVSTNNKVPEDQYDMVHYVLLDHTYGGVAFPNLHRAFTYYASGNVTTATFIHETLHLFGASDKYNNNDCSTIGTNDPFGRYNGTLPGSDIMCSNFNADVSRINDITAREIGWAN